MQWYSVVIAGKKYIGDHASMVAIRKNAILKGIGCSGISPR